MLNAMRKLSKGIVAKLLMLLLVISFGIWGIGDIFRSGGPRYAAKVNGEPISLGEFEQRRVGITRQLESMGMRNVDPGQIAVSVVRQLVQQRLTLLAMHDLGLFAGDDTVSHQIASDAAFKDDKGKFSAKLFRERLAAMGMSEKGYLMSLKKEVSGQFLIDSLSMTDASAPKSVMAIEHALGSETRDAVIINIPSSTPAEAPDEAAQKEYYELNKNIAFMTPEERTLQYIVVSKQDLDAITDAAITDEMLAEGAKTRPSLNKELLRMKLRDEKRDGTLREVSNMIEDELAAGKTIEEAFAKAGLHSQPKLLEHVTAENATNRTEDIESAVVQTGLGLSEGEVSGFVRSKQGATIMVAAKKIIAAAPKPFAQVQEDVRAQLIRQRSQDAAATKAREVKEALAKEPNWQSVVNKFNLSTRVFSNLGRPSPKAGNDSALPPALQQSLFEHKVGEVAGPMSLPDGGQMLAVVTQIHMPKVSSDAANLDAEVAKRMTQKLSADVESQAYESFVKKYPVEVNNQFMRSLAGQSDTAQ